MALQILRVAPPPPHRPIPARERFTGNAAADWFENVVRPDRFDPKEIEVTAELRRHLVEWESADGQFLRNADFEFDFLAGQQWIDEYGDRRDAARDLERKGRSAFTIDLLTPSIELVVNQMRINKTTATFIPIGGYADKIGEDV